MTITTPERTALVGRLEKLAAESEKLAKHEKLTASQDRRFAEIAEEFEMLDGRLKSIDRRDQLDKVRTAARSGHVEHGSPPGEDRSSRRPASELRNRALDLIERSEGTTDHLNHDALEFVTRAVERDDSGVDITARWVLGSGSDEYRGAFRKFILGREREWTAAEVAAVDQSRQLERAMSLTDAAGGFMVPFQLDSTIILSSGGSVHPFRQIARTVTTTSDVWNGVTSAGATAEWVAEAAEVADASPTIAQPSIPVWKYDVFCPYSVEIADDGANFETEIAEVMADAVDQLHATAFTTGSGSGQPTGIVTALTGTASVVTGTTMTAAEIVATQNALPPRFQPRAQWAGALAHANTIATMETTNGALLHPGMSDSQRRLLGKPFNETSTMDSTIAGGATADYALIYGDWRHFVIADRLGSRVERIDHLFGANRRPTLQRGLILWGRVGSDSIVDNAFRMLNAAS